MAYEPKDGDISIFKNKNRTKDTQPTHRGSILWNGQKLKISLWPKQTKDGDAYLGGSAQIDDYVPTPQVPASVIDDFMTDAPQQPQSELPPSDPIPEVLTTDGDALPF